MAQARKQRSVSKKAQKLPSFFLVCVFIFLQCHREHGKSRGKRGQQEHSGKNFKEGTGDITSFPLSLPQLLSLSAELVTVSGCLLPEVRAKEEAADSFFCAPLFQ